MVVYAPSPRTTDHGRSAGAFSVLQGRQKPVECQAHPVSAGANRSGTTGLPEGLVTRPPGLSDLPGFSDLLSLPSLLSLLSLPREIVHRPTGCLVHAVAGRNNILRTWIQGGDPRGHRPQSRDGAHGATPAVAGHPVQARGPAEVPPGHAAAVRASL